jgi:hypothetical protein
MGAPVGAAFVGAAETCCTCPLLTKSLIEPGWPFTVVVTFTLDKLSKVSPGWTAGSAKAAILHNPVITPIPIIFEWIIKWTPIIFLSKFVELTMS